MNKVTRQLRPGFFGIEILVVLIVCAVIFGVISMCSKPADSEPPKSETGTAQTVTETARAGSAVLRLTKDAAADAPPVDVPAVDPTTTTDPSFGFGLLEIIQDVLEGLF